ncbi:PAP2 superfamily protein [Lachnospiraceae bacterium JC7]|nr:PAP2 superfamily protein [Lachnospiraceae bacterium JC7]
MEFSILYSIVRTAFLDSFFLTLTSIVGSYGQLFLITGILMTVFKKTRKTGIALLLLYFGVLLFGQLLLKNLFSRPRPCQIDQTFALLIARPTSSSFPSTHSSWAFGAATVVFLNYRKAGAVLFIFAALIAFSRLYLFMHFPTDVLFGILMGIILGIAAVKLSDRFVNVLAAKKSEI